MIDKRNCFGILFLKYYPAQTGNNTLHINKLCMLTRFFWGKNYVRILFLNKFLKNEIKQQLVECLEKQLRLKTLTKEIKLN